MGLLDRWRGRDTDDGGDPTAPAGPEEDALAPVEEVTTRALTDDDTATLDAARAGYAERGIDPADLGTVQAAYEAALDRLEAGGSEADATAAVSAVATAAGDHLTLHGYRWVVATDPYGTDLALEPPRRGVPVVVRTLVAVRWMRRDRGWVENVVGHLAATGRR